MSTAGISEFPARVLVFGRLHLLRLSRSLSHRKLHSIPQGNGFFDLYPRFYSTSITTATPNRLNHRHRALIEFNTSIIRGKTVLDLASHDGRWSFAAHKAGARHVLGIEARDHLVKSAHANMQEYRVPHEQYDFILGDVFEELDRLKPNTIDSVFCFGFLYHTIDHMLLLSKIAGLNPSHVIVDTEIALDPGSVIQVRPERIAGEGHAAVPCSGDPAHTLVGRPSKMALELMLSSCGWTWVYYDWHHVGIKRWDDLEDYHEGWRLSLTASA